MQQDSSIRDRSWRASALALALGLTGACAADHGAFGIAGESETPAVAVPEGQGGSAQAGQLTAGEWRDLDHWRFWRDLFAREDIAPYESQWGFYTARRFPVTVMSEDVPLADADVVLLGADDEPLWRARTDVRGEAELFAGLFDDQGSKVYALEVVTSDGVRRVGTDLAGKPRIFIDAAGDAPPRRLDLMFVIDTTGSMGDELTYLQVELADVIDRVRDEVGQDVALRLSVNFYRDAGDDYELRSFPFTSDVDDALADLDAQSADTGGDVAEAVHSALADAVDGHAWSEAATARLCFLVLDAPPHEADDVLAGARESVRRFAERGIRLIPIAASGVDQPTEFMLRSYAVVTGGTYTFLTDDSGIGNPHTVPTIGEYEVERLNDLLVRLIAHSLEP